MKFHEQLNSFVKEIGCTNQEIASVSHLGIGTISRYRSGERVPRYESTQIRDLAGAIYVLGHQKGLPLNEEAILRSLTDCLADSLDISYDHFLRNLTSLLGVLEIRNIDLARSMHMDPSLISRILSGHRRPVDMSRFIRDVSDCSARKCVTPEDRLRLAGLFECDPEEFDTPQAVRQKTVLWLGSHENADTKDPVHSFLEKLDTFDLGEFTRNIHFDDMKVPSAPFTLPLSKVYTGIEQMKQAELDFLRSAVLSRSSQDVILYSDMPIQEMHTDEEFLKKWMFSMALLLKKGLHLHQIHDVHRPLPEMMLGLEGWIPMYMTGQISPYYLEKPTGHTFLHFIRSAGTVAISGEAIEGRQSNGRYYVTTGKQDVQYFRTRARDLLRKARPLMKIYPDTQSDKLRLQLDRLLKKGARCRLLCTDAPCSSVISYIAGQKDVVVEKQENSHFQNIEILVSPARFVLVVKCNTPLTSFLIYHPKMVEAFEKYTETDPAQAGSK